MTWKKRDDSLKKYRHWKEVLFGNKIILVDQFHNSVEAT
jgi:hypothetical protein